MLGVLPHKLIKGCSSLRTEADLQHFKNNCQTVISLKEMLDTQYRTDAHFTSYNVVGIPMWPRMNKSILPEIRQSNSDIVLAYFTFDWDNTNHAEWTDEAKTQFITLIKDCTDPIINSWSAIYFTKHGARIIYKLSKPVPVDDGEQHLSWMFNHLGQKGFDKIDEGCNDWTRLMRCPQVTRDNQQTWEQDYYSCIYREMTLDINFVGKRSIKTVANKLSYVPDRREKPDFALLETQLHGVNKTTQKRNQTVFYKKAKKILKDSEYVDILFSDTIPGWVKGDRNTQICLMLGRITPMLIQKARATIVQIFALAIQPLLALDNDQDWVGHGWNALQDIYAREVNKYNLEEEERAEGASKEADLLDGMVEGMKTWCNHPDLDGDEEKAREFVKANILASVKGFFYVLGSDGFYEEFAVQQNQIISRIRKTYLSTIIPTSKVNYTGEVADVNSTALQNEFSTPVSEVHMRPVGEMGGHIEDLNGKKPVMVMSTFCRNDDLVPTFDEHVHGWLKELFGLDLEKGLAWIANALAFEDGLICAISLEGASSAGKKLFSIGLSECLKVPYIATPDDIYGQSSAFLKTPFLVVDESWPTGLGKTAPADKFKSLTGGDGMTVDEKFMPKIRILCPVRMILTANDDGIIRTLTKGKSMGVDNRIAVGERLFHMKVSARAAAYLNSIGGRGWTARKGQRWIRPDAGSDASDFVVAKHFLWLYHHRDTVDPSQRFLVMGNCAPGAGDGSLTVVQKLLAESNHTPIAARAIIEMFDSPTGVYNQYFRTNTELTCLKVTRQGVYQYVKRIMEERLTESQVFEGLLNIVTTPEPENIDDIHWFDIDVQALSYMATEWGIQLTKVRQIYANRIAKGM